MLAAVEAYRILSERSVNVKLSGGKSAAPSSHALNCAPCPQRFMLARSLPKRAVVTP